MKRIACISLVAALVVLILGLCFNASAQLQPIDVTGPTYDTPNQAFTKVNSNDTYLDGRFGTMAAFQIPFSNSGATAFSYDPDLYFHPTNFNFRVGKGSTSSGTYNVNFGYQTTLSGSWALTVAETSTIRGNNSLSSGWSHEVGDGTNTSGGTFTFGTDNRNYGIGSYAGGIGGQITYVSTSQRGGFVHAFQQGSVDGKKPATVPYLIANDGAGNISRNTASQTSGHGSLAQDGFILGGIDHDIPSTSPRSVILGGNGIKARASASDWTYTTNFHTLGSVLMSGSSSDTPTSNSRIDIRALGTGTNKGFRFADSGNTELFYIKDNGTIGVGTVEPYTSTSTIIFRPKGTVSGTFSGLSIAAADSYTQTSGDQNVVFMGGSPQPSSGTMQFTVLNIAPSLGATGTFSGVFRGLYYNPSVVGLASGTHIAFENVTGQLRFGGITQDDTKTQMLAKDATTNQVFWRDVSTISGGGGITNTAAANELMKSDGTNAVASGLFSTTLGNISLGTGATGASRTITADGSATDVALLLTTKGAGALQTSTNAYTSFSSAGVASGSSAFNSAIYSGSGYTNAIPHFRVSNQTTGTPANGIGAGIELHSITSSGNFETIGNVEAVTTSVSAGAEYSDVVIKSMQAGTLIEGMRIAPIGGGLTRITTTATNGFDFSSATKLSTTKVNGSMKVGLVGDETIDRRLHVEENSTATNTVLYPLRLTRVVGSGNGATGVGTGMEFEVENAGGTNVVSTLIESVSTDATAASEDADLIIKNISAGTAIETFRVTSGAGINVTQATPGNALLKLTTTATNDDPTLNVYQNRVATTDATVTTIHTYTVPSSTTVKVKAEIVARRTGGTAGTAEDGAAYEFVATYKNVAGTATLIGAVTALYTAESQTAWDATFTTSGANVLTQVTGALDNSVTWHLTKFEVMQVSN